MPACRSMACYSFASAARSEWLPDAGIRTACHVIDVIDGLLPTIDFGATSGASSTHQYVGPMSPTLRDQREGGSHGRSAKRLVDHFRGKIGFRAGGAGHVAVANGNGRSCRPTLKSRTLSLVASPPPAFSRHLRRTGEVRGGRLKHARRVAAFSTWHSARTAGSVDRAIGHIRSSPSRKRLSLTRWQVWMGAPSAL